MNCSEHLLKVRFWTRRRHIVSRLPITADRVDEVLKVINGVSNPDTKALELKNNLDNLKEEFENLSRMDFQTIPGLILEQRMIDAAWDLIGTPSFPLLDLPYAKQISEEIKAFAAAKAATKTSDNNAFVQS